MMETVWRKNVYSYMVSKPVTKFFADASNSDAHPIIVRRQKR